MRKYWVPIVCFLMWNQGLFSAVVLSHSETEKARFVAESGTDNGQCNNRFRPCKTIQYAVTQANKGDRVLVAQGSYRVETSESIVYLLANTHPVLGGFNHTDNYQNQSPDKFITTLIGVPKQHAQKLYEKGFQVISDSKGSEVSAQIDKGLEAISLMQNTQAASACIDGDAGGFSCRGLSLLGRLPLSELPTNSRFANDIWGHLDLNDMREYAIIGLQRGLVVVDVSNPEALLVVGSISGQSTTWRDIKVYQYFDSAAGRFKAYAYSGGDNVSEGLSIVDLSQLPQSIRLVNRNKIDAQSHNIYISNVNYTTNSVLNGQQPLLHVTGSNNFGGAWRTYLLSSPETPQVAYTNTRGLRSDYTHDASSLLIDDERAQTDCLLSLGSNCNIIVDFNESEVRLWEHSNPQEATQLSQFTYPNLDYVHSGWWSEDKQYIFVNDELDERRFSLNTSINVFDISDLRSPRLVETWRGPTRATDHNGFVKGNKYYMSNYERGVTVLDIKDPTAITEIGVFDTFGASNNASFNGVWGVYPYLPSGNLLASDIQGGLYIIKDETLQPTDDAAGFSASQLSVNEGTTVAVEVIKQGQGDLSVDYHILQASVDQHDISGPSGTLQWSANDDTSQFINIDILQDAEDEFDELAIVVLTNPKNGDIINAKSLAFVTIEGTLANTGQISFNERQLNALETQGSISLTVNRVGGKELDLRAKVSLSSDSATINEDFEFTGGLSELDLFWPDGDTTSRSVSIDIINDRQAEATEIFSVSLSAAEPSLIGNIAQLQIQLKDDESNVAPTVNAGSDIQVNTRQSITLNGASASDDEGEITISWTQTGGPAVTLTNSDSLQASFIAPATAASITLTITATDEFGLIASDDIIIAVIAPPASTFVNRTSGSGGSIGIALFLLFTLVVSLRNLDVIQYIKRYCLKAFVIMPIFSKTQLLLEAFMSARVSIQKNKKQIKICFKRDQNMVIVDE